MPGRFISFEGLDGSGITTQATLLRNYFLSKKRDVVLTKEPTDGLIGGLIRSCLRKEWKTNPTTLHLLYTADRAHHLATEIEPALKKNKTVISDRYMLSALAYGSLDMPLSILEQLNANFRKPHITFLIDTQPAICIDRIKKSRHHVELFEDEQKLVEIRNNYLTMKNSFPNTYVIDGNRMPEEVMRDVQKIVDKSMTI